VNRVSVYISYRPTKAAVDANSIKALHIVDDKRRKKNKVSRMSPEMYAIRQPRRVKKPCLLS